MPALARHIAALGLMQAALLKAAQLHAWQCLSSLQELSAQQGQLAAAVVGNKVHCPIPAQLLPAGPHCSVKLLSLLLLLLPLTFSSFPAFRFFWAVVRLPRLLIFLQCSRMAAEWRQCMAGTAIKQRNAAPPSIRQMLLNTMKVCVLAPKPQMQSILCSTAQP
jgi:hypothetical protein